MTDETQTTDEVKLPSLDEAGATGSLDEGQQLSQPSREKEAKALEDQLAALRAEIAEAKSKAQEAVDAHRRAQGTADRANRDQQKRIERLQAQVEAVATSGMSEDQLRTWKMQRELDELRERSPRTEVDDQVERSEFSAWSGPFLQEEGIPTTDPTLNEAFNRLAASGKSAADWKIALTRAVAEVRKAQAKKVADEAKEREEKAREDERNKLKNAQRAASGKLDEGGTVSGKNFRAQIDSMAPGSPEFMRLVEEAKAGRLRNIS